ncbi:hypothetical protein K3175_05620 [Qipengyuania sp. GH1]|uniref:hypothetical protein n=1 Tax=Qipengyuania aestuarii TaxID=2867241 RepID=UPI001C86CBFD|nr:hypothetical protein [Qipengyuania aestuarii]MBX7535131.1 hypothetical protein [Qipengyuania aestuarii]
MERQVRRFAFEVGTYVQIEERILLITLVNPSHTALTLLDQHDRSVVEYSQEELEALFEEGTLRFVSFVGESLDVRIRPRSSEPLSTMPDKERVRVELRLSVIKAVDSLGLGTHSERIIVTDPATGEKVFTSRIQNAINEACYAAGQKPVTVQTYYNWRKLLSENEDVSALAGNFGNRGRKPYLDPVVEIKVQQALATAVEVSRAQTHLGARGRITPKKIINSLRQELPEEKLPSPSYIHQKIQQLPAYDRAVAQKGARAADNQFRMASRAEKPTACLDSVEYDETRLKLVLVDEEFGIPLGSPYLSWYVDRYSDAPPGFYVGYEPMSDVSTMAALRHACLPKGYMRKHYPDIRGSMCAGIPRSITLDNGLSQHGDTIQSAAKDLSIDIRYAPPYRAWFKGAVEGMHETLNRLLLEDQAGYVLRPQDQPSEYDPTTQACLGVRQFVRILHHWIADRYMQTPTGVFRRSPAEKWAEGISSIPPTFLPSVEEADLVFGILREGTLDHRGVRYENLFYLSDEMVEYRRLHGVSISVDVKVGPHMGRIYWRGPDGAWRSADADLYEYAWGRTLHNHKLVRNRALEVFRSDKLEALLESDRQLKEIARAALPMQLGLKRQKRIARAFGIGTETLLSNHQTDGKLECRNQSPAHFSETAAEDDGCLPRQKLRLTTFDTERRGE